MNQKNLNYIAWQNKSLQFYLAARLLFFNEQYDPACVSAQHCLELKLRATLLYWDEAFAPESTLLGIAGLIRTLRGQVTGAEQFEIPHYLCAKTVFELDDASREGRLHANTEPKLLADLDTIFYQLLSFVPYQEGSVLRQTLAGQHKKELAILRRANAQMKPMRKLLTVKLK
jgi:hypothetical protein